MSKQLPPIAYSDQHNGLLDPQRPTITERLRTSPAWLDQHRRDAEVRSPFVQALRRVASRALQPGKRGRK